MYPILTRYGPFFLYSFTVVMSLGVLAGVGETVWQAKKRAVHPGWLDGVLAALVLGLMGGRIGFVWLEWTYFGERPYEIIQIQLGGLTYHGALLGGLLGWWSWGLWRKRPLLADADLLAPALALVSAFGWLACWLDGCGYGREAAPGSLLAASLPDNLGIIAWRYQTQLLGLGLSFIIFLWIRVRQRNWPVGRALWFTLFALSVSRIPLYWLRGDKALQIAGLRADLILDVLFALISFILLKYTKQIVSERKSS